ncbi:DUF4148 domain-containing protein [Paraburkholderia unamae]|uniref:Uncharacterized protein DUF4148 n=1 Tax=Paraburkholderia unamae TaxID=219649 RepID=A0ABX5K748_9BURK|nr:DUF4148 domain-containing protein [Paraburkholderia unamae]PVX61367.1 uncharacterized protein DUF4148 [Paraburkholderia unamae]
MRIIKRIAAAALLAAPVVVLAQSAAPSDEALTRAQVRQDQIQVEQQGYNPSIGDQASYPRDAQAAEARVGAQQVDQAANGGYGGAMPGSSAAGEPVGMAQPAQAAHTARVPDEKSVYFGQ